MRDEVPPEAGRQAGNAAVRQSPGWERMVLGPLDRALFACDETTAALFPHGDRPREPTRWGRTYAAWLAARRAQAAPALGTGQDTSGTEVPMPME